MKRFNEEVQEEVKNHVDIKNDVKKEAKLGEQPNEESNYKRFEEEQKSEDCITPAMKVFRMIMGGIGIVSVIYIALMGTSSENKNYKNNIKSGKIQETNAGDILTEKAIKLQPKNFAIESARGYGKIELSVWNFAEQEDGDYVQVFVNGTPETEPFQIRHKPTKIGVPDKAVIQVRGIKDGSHNGITYGVFFNKTGETYLNTVPLNATNTYTLKPSK